MKNLITYLKTMWSSGANSQSSDVSHDCRLTRGVLCFLGKLARRIYSFGCSQDILGAPQSLHSSPSGMTAKLQVNSFMRFAVVLTLIFTLGVGNVWGETKSKEWDLTSSSGDFTASNCVTYFSQPYGMKKENAYIQTQSISDFTTYASSATKIEISVKCLQNGGTTSKLTVYLLDKDGSTLGSQEIIPVNASSAAKTTYQTATFSSSLSTATGFRVTCTTIVKNILINGAKYTITYTPAVSCTTNPTVGAGSNISVTSTTATVSCSSGISSLGSAGCSISSYGFVIGKSSDPEIGGSGVTQHEVGTTYTSTGVSFSKELTGLTASTTYYVRPYATNGNGTAYGTQTSFTTSALPKYTVTLKDDGDTRTQASAGASVTLPVRAGCAGYTFAGWTKTWGADQTEWTTTAPTIIPAGSYTPTANENLYPVYTKTEGGGGPTTESYGFEEESPTNWTIRSQPSRSNSNAHSGSYAGYINTNHTYVTFKEKVKVTAFSFWLKRTSTNSNYNVYIETSTNGTDWSAAATYKMSDFGNGTYTQKEMTWDGSTAYYVRFHCYNTTAARYVDDISITYSGGSTTYYISEANCCTPLGTINGSINLSQLATPDPTKLKASWAMNAVTGIASYTLEVYDSSDNLVKTINNYTSGSEITGLTPCTGYYVKLYTVSSGGEYCDGGLIGTSGSCKTNGYTLTVNRINVSLNSGSEPTNICGDVSATYAASAGYTLPTSISVTNAGAENTGWTWNSSTGVLTINKASVTGNVTVTITGTAQSNFPNNKTIFIQAHSTSAWTGGGCVKAWFHSYGGSETAQPTYWLFDAGSPDEGKKLFAAIVPTTGDLPYLDIQRFAANCSEWWNKNGGCSYSDAAGSNTIRSEGSGNDQVYWNASGVTLSLYGDPNSWVSSLGTFADQGAGVWTATYNNYAPANAAGETQNFKISTNYNGWIGNTGSNDNATLDGMHVGSTYNITATLDVKDHSLTMSKTFVKGTVHFDLQGHGSTISDLTNVAAGSKISAPSPAPSATGWDFGGWFKEQACTNEWNFASDVVNETMTLYAKWTKTPVEELLLNYSELNKYVDDPAVTLEVTGVTPEGADASVTWSSSNSSVASVVAATGVVTFGTVGTATITATSTVTGTTTAYCHVTVRNKPTATFVDLIHDGNGTDLSTYNMQNVAGTAIVFPTLDDYATPGDDCDTKHYVFVGWTTSDNNDDPQDHLVASGELEDGQDKVFYAVWADGVEGVSYTKLTSNSFDGSPAKYVIGVESGGDTYYLYNCASTDANNSWGYTTNAPGTNAPIQFTLSGTADALVATSTEASARYLTPLTAKNFQMSATSKTVKLNSDGTIHNTGDNSAWNLRGNSTNLRWYDGTTGTSAYFYKITAGAAVSYRTSCCTNNVPAPTVIATNTAYTVTLTWGAVDGATGYEVSWNGGAFEAATSPCVKSGLTASTDYIYKVRATYDPLVKCGALVASGNVTTDDVYSVTYSGGTGTGSCSPSGSVAPVSYEAGATVTLAATNSFSLTSNTFAAWVVKDAENNDVAVSNNQFTMPASNVTVTATWTAVQDKYYDRMHQSTDALHGGIADGNGKYYIVREGCNYTVPSPADDKTGDTDCHTTHFKLLGWIAQSHLKSDGSIKDGEESFIFQGGTIKSATGATYYAIYAIMTE